MKEFLTYTAEVALLVSLVYIIYRFIFARDALHVIKRILLLSMIVLSFILPLCKMTTYKRVVVYEKEIPVSITPAVHNDLLVPLAEPTVEIDWMLLFAILYCTGVSFVVLFQFIGMVRISFLMKKVESQHSSGGIPIFILPFDIQPFSFGRKIIISRSDYEKNGEMIIRHEAAHVKQCHHIDLIVVNMALAMQWFNPFMWLMKNELLLSHEYSADKAVIKSGIDAKQYQYLLISKVAIANGFIPEVNHLCSGNLRKRIRIMKRKTSTLASLKLLIMLPLVGLALMAFAETRYNVVYQNTNTTDSLGKEVSKPFEGKIGSKFSDSRGRLKHRGIDVVTTNDTIRAPFSGIVKSATYNDVAGNLLELSHENNIETSYAHLSRFLVKENQKVNAGDPIAIVGSTGKSTGVHLHMECSINGKLVDPVTVLGKSITTKNEKK